MGEAAVSPLNISAMVSDLYLRSLQDLRAIANTLQVPHVRHMKKENLIIRKIGRAHV